MALPIRALGMVWYRAEDYSAILRIMSDRNKLPAQYAIWRMQAESLEKKLRREGHIIFRAYIDPETFPEWCRSRGLNIDAEARNQFAALVAKDNVGGTH